MQVKSRLDTFISSTYYRDPVDIKRLKFIFQAINRYAGLRSKEIRNLRILEIGCGRGRITLPLASLGCQVRAFDIDTNCVEYLQTQISQNKIKNLIVTVNNGYTFDDGKTYDIVIASEVFEHVLEPSKLLANITKKLVEGSYLIVTTPNGYGPWELKNRLSPICYLTKWNWLRNLFGKPLYVKREGAYHCQFFTMRSLVKLLSKFSLRLVNFAKSDSFLAMFPPLSRSALFGNIDIRLADLLPYWLASGWFFVFVYKRKPGPG